MNLGAGAVERVGLDSEPDYALVLFFTVLQKRRELGRLADQDRQQSGRERIERAQMADARGPHARLDLAHGLGRSDPGRLVDKQNSVHGR